MVNLIFLEIQLGTGTVLTIKRIKRSPELGPEEL
jgi:hypothetical protein